MARSVVTLLLVKKLLAIVGLAVCGVLSLSFMVALGRWAAYRDNAMKCADPVSEGALESLSVELPENALACRKSDKSEFVDMELLVEKPGALCFLSAGLFACPSVVKNQLAFMRSMERAGWEQASAYDKSEIRFLRGKNTSATVRLRQDSYGEVAATMSLHLPAAKLGKQ